LALELIATVTLVQAPVARLPLVVLRLTQLAVWPAAPRYGMDRASARERLAALAYDHAIAISRDQHAVERSRRLFALSLQYPTPGGLGDYGVDGAVPAASPELPPGLLFLHGTAQHRKLWPEQHWIALAQLAQAVPYRVWLPWGNSAELERAQRIAAAVGNAEVLPRMSLRDLAALCQRVRGAVAVDTGLGHLAAAFSVPTVSLYGPTSTRLIGAYGRNQVHLQSPLANSDITDPQTLMRAITPAATWQALQALVAKAA
jgi:heptosyltransferase-1